MVFSWCLYDFANSAFATTILAVIYNRYYAGVVAGGADGVQITLPWGTHHIHGATLFTYLVAISMFVVALTSPLLGAWADSRASRKRFLAVYLTFGVVATAFLAQVQPGEWLEGGVLFIIANIAFAGGNVFYNSFLREIASPDEMGKVSGWGWGIGYLGGGILLALNLVMLQAPHLLGVPDDTFTVRHTFLTVAVWWLLFSLPLLLSVKERAVESSPSTLNGAVESIKRLRDTFSQIRRYRHLFIFLLAYLLFNDGIETVIVMASIFGDQELGISQSMLIVYFLMVQFTAFFGSLLFGRISGVLGNKSSLLLTLYIWCLVLLAAFFIGWTGYPVLEYFMIGIVAGLVMGASQSIARGIQGTFTPPGKEAEFFGFFAVSGRFAAIFGPLTYGITVALTGSLRMGILSLLVFFAVGILLLFKVDEKAGRRAAHVQP